MGYALLILGYAGVVPAGGVSVVIDKVDFTIGGDSLFPAFWEDSGIFPLGAFS